MKKISLLLTLLMVSLGAVAAGPLAMKMDDFMELRVRGPLNVDYVNCPDSAGMVLVSAPVEEQLSWVEVSGSGRKLSLNIFIPNDLIVRPQNLPSVRVYSSFLTKIDNEGDSTVRVLSASTVAQFSARVIGNGRIGVHSIKAGEVNATVLAGHGIVAVSGECNKASLKLTGTGVIQADGLLSKNAYVWNTGTGSVGVWATDKLTIKGAGSGTVYVVGSPEIIGNKGRLKVQPIE